MNKSSVIMVAVLLVIITTVITSFFSLEIALWTIGILMILDVSLALIQVGFEVAIRKQNILFKISELLETVAFIFCGVVLIIGLSELYSKASTLSITAFGASVVYIIFYRFKKHEASQKHHH